MSGGSFDYLYLKDDLPKYALEQMADELDALAAEGVPGAAEAAAETRRYIAPEHAVPIRDVWHAVEWWRSSDWGKDDVLEALGEYKGTHDG